MQNELKEAKDMAKVVVTGNALVVTSTIKFEDLKLVKKYRPEALTLFEGEGKEKTPVFKIGIGKSGNGDLNKYGAEFCGATHDDDKYAVITLIHEFNGEDIKEEVSDLIGTSILKLNKLEAELPAVVQEIADEKAAIMENVTLV
jgi:hypothetical protein